MWVDFVTFCCPKDIRRLYSDSELAKRVASHDYQFHEIIVVHQRCSSIDDVDSNVAPNHRIVKSEDHPHILEEFGLPESDPIADHWTHGANAAHYWKWHVINHLIGLKVSIADFIVFSDCDCRILSQPSSWVTEGLKLLDSHHNIFMVSPSDGGQMAEKMLPGGVRLTQNVSQQIFLCDRQRLSNTDLDIPWDWEYTAPGGPMQEYYYMLEGRIWRHLHKHCFYRAILPEKWRYWHDQWH